MDTLLPLIDAIGARAMDAGRGLVAIVTTWVATQPAWLPATLALGLAASAAAVIVMRRGQAFRRKAAARPAGARPGRGAALNLKPPAPRRPSRTPVDGARHARELVHHGVPALEIARRTGLSRDAVSLLLAQAGAADRHERPRAAGVSPLLAGGTAAPRASFHA